VRRELQPRLLEAVISGTEAGRKLDLRDTLAPQEPGPSGTVRASEKPPAFSRGMCLEFAVGSVAG